MIKKEDKNIARARRHARVRKSVFGTQVRPRLNVFRSNAEIYAQIIDDETGTTLVSSSSIALKIKNGGNIDGAAAVGADIAKKALEKNIKQVVFDRGGYQYHGRVEALANAARENGLDF